MRPGYTVKRGPTLAEYEGAARERASSCTVGAVVGCPECETMREYIRDHVHAYIDSDEIDKLLSFEEWRALQAPNNGMDGKSVRDE